MAICHAGAARPPLHVLASESDLVASLALQIEYRQPVVAAMLLDEIERAELHEPETLPEDAARLGSQVCFVDERTGQMRKVQLVLPADANISAGRISIATPMGAALYGVSAGEVIDWPDVAGRERRISVWGVEPPRQKHTRMNDLRCASSARVLPRETDYSTLDDLSLAQLCGKRDRDAARHLITVNNQRLFRTAWSVLKDRGEAEEAVQAAYLSAFAGISSFEGRSSISTWLTRIVLNEAFGRMRKRRRREQLESEAAPCSAIIKRALLKHRLPRRPTSKSLGNSYVS